MGTVLTTLEVIPAVDQHAHPVLTPAAAAHRPLVAAFTEADDPELVSRHAGNTLCYRRSLRDLAELLGCEPTEAAVLTARDRLGPDRLAARCLGAARLECVLLDDGYLAGECLPIDWHQRFVPSRRVMRIESLAEHLLIRERSFDDFLDRFNQAVASPPAGVVALKSILAYRTGLDVRPVKPRQARDAYEVLRAHPPERLASKPLLDFLFCEALQAAAHRGMPVQLHTGFGDPDLDLRLANPLHLRPLLEDPIYRGAPLVLLHASYPYTRQAGYLASVYPQVYLDVGLAVPLLSVSGMRNVVRQLLELAPWSKLLYSSDARLVPDLFYLGARWGRQTLGWALEEAVKDGELTEAEAEEAGAAVLAGNARGLYGLRV